MFYFSISQAPEEGGAAVVFPGTVYNDDQEHWEARLRPLISERQQMRAQQGRAAPIHAPYSHRQEHNAAKLCITSHPSLLNLTYSKIGGHMFTVE